MKSSYWIQRKATARLVASEKIGQEALVDSLKLYELALKRINRELNALYSKYADKVGLDVAELTKLLTGADKADFINSLQAQMKALGFRIEDVYQPGYLEAITRLDAFKQQVYWEIMQVAPQDQAIQTSAYKEIVNSTYEQMAYDTREAMNLAPSFGRIDKRTVAEILTENWVGRNYSDSIWRNTDKLARELPYLLGSALLIGQGSAKTAREVRERFGVSQSQAMNLVRTETNYFYNQAELQAYQDDGFLEYEYAAILDGRTSEICEELDGQIFLVKDAEAGKNYPPMHGRCRSGTKGRLETMRLERMTAHVEPPPRTQDELIPDDTESAFEYIARKVGSDTVQPDGRDWYPSDKGGWKVNIFENELEVKMNAILVQDKGKGFGSDIMNYLKEYAEAKDKVVIIQDVVNAPFFDKFKWLKPQEGARDSLEYIYFPMEKKLEQTLITNPPAPKEGLAQYADLAKYENTIRQSPTSTGAIFDKLTGKNLSTFSEDYASSYAFTNRQLGLAEGNILTRNDVDNLGISPADLRTGLENAVNEIRVVQDTQTLSMKLRDLLKKTAVEREEIADHVVARYEQMIEAGRGEEAERIAKEFNFQFIKE